MTIAELIRAAIERWKDQGQTVYSLSLKSGVQQQTIHAFVRDTQSLRLPTAQRLIDALGIVLEVKGTDGK